MEIGGREIQLGKEIEDAQNEDCRQSENEGSGLTAKKMWRLGCWCGRWDWSGHNIYENCRFMSPHPALSPKGEGHLVESSAYFMSALSVLRDPVCKEDVEFMWLGGIAIRGPHQLFTIWREHGEAIKGSIEGNLAGV